jgi:hypothetical protein
MLFPVCGGRDAVSQASHTGGNTSPKYKAVKNPKKYTCRRGTHNIYTQKKTQDTLYKHLIFNYN